MIDPIVLDDIINDCNVRLIGEMGENGEHTENELVFDGDNLTQRPIADAFESGQPSTNTTQKTSGRKKKDAASSRSRKGMGIVQGGKMEDEVYKTGHPHYVLFPYSILEVSHCALLLTMDV